MKLLYITNAISGPGGLERVLSTKASYFTDQYDYEVHILTLNDSRNHLFYTFSDKIHFHDIDCKGNKIIYFFQYIKGLRRIISEINPDIISVCDDGLKGFLVPLFLGGKPCPMIYERHVSKLISLGNRSANYFDHIKFRMMNYAARFYDRFVVLTKDNIDEWRGLDNLEAISNPLSFYPNEIPITRNKRIIAVGKVSYQKGYERLLDAWQLINNESTGWSVHIYGAENDKGKLRTAIKEKNLSTSFVLHEPTQNIELEYLNSSIYAFPSRFEGFGMVLIEAMACGLPCVSFDCPCGPRDIINDGIDGYLVSNGDIRQLADKLFELISDDNLRDEMVVNARQNVKRFSIETIGKQWKDLFYSLCPNAIHINSTDK